MALDRIKGISIKIGADATELNDALSGVNKQLSTTNSALRDVNKLLKLDPKNTELLTQKQGLLKDAITATKQRLDKLKEAQTKATNPADYDVLQREIVETEQKLKGLEKEYKAFGTVQGQQLQAAGKKMQELGGKISNIGQSLSTKLTVPIVAAFTAAGKSASDYEENLNKIDTAFGDSAKEVKAWADTATEQFGLSKVAATEAASGFGALAKGIGLSEGAAADVSISLAGLSSDLSSYFNVSTDESAKALEGIFTGEAEALKKFGVVMNETNLEKFAADHGKVWKEASQSEKVMLRYQYVLEKTKDAQGDYARTSDGTANSFRTFQAALQNLAVVIGQKLLPIITPLVQKITEWVDKFSQMNPATAELVVKIGLFLAALGPVMTVLGPIVSILGKVLVLIGGGSGTAGLIGGIGGLVSAAGPAIAIAAGIAAVGLLVYKNWDKIAPMFKKLGKNIASFAKKAGKAITDFGKKAGEVISTGMSAMISTIAGAWNGIQKDTVQKWNNIKSTVSTAWKNIRDTATTWWGNIKTAVSTGVKNIRTEVHDRFEKVKTSVGSAWKAIKNNTSEWMGKIKTTTGDGIKAAGKAMTDNFSAAKSAMGTAFGTVKTAGTNALNAIGTAATNAFNAVKEKYKGGFGTVISDIKAKFSGIGSAITTPFKNAWETIRKFPNALRNLFSGVKITLPKFKLPHLKVSWKQLGNFIKIPQISVQWYKKAYENAVMFKNPTVLQTPYGAKGFGDGNGAEVVMGLNRLKELVGSGGETSIVINVNAPQGMNVNQLADQIQRRLAAVQKQKVYSMT